METLDSPILLSRSFKKCVAAFLAPLSAAYFPICALSCVQALYLLRGDHVAGFKSPDRERFTALFASSISFQEREETLTWSGNNFFVVAECARGCMYYIMRKNLIWRFFTIHQTAK